METGCYLHKSLPLITFRFNDRLSKDIYCTNNEKRTVRREVLQVEGFHGNANELNNICIYRRTKRD